MGALLDARDTAVAAAALDALTGTLLDTTRDDAVRLRAFEAIGNAGDRSETYDADVLEPLRAQLRTRRVRSAARERSAARRHAAVMPPTPR